jgi:hypothetical protein
MALEAATYIADLVSTNPTGLDQKKDGDNHIRLLKQVIKNTFPTASRAFFLRSWAEKEKGFVEKAEDYTMIAEDDGKLIQFDCSGGNRVYTLLPIATAAAGFVVFINRDESSTNTLTLDGDGTETINGEETLVVRRGFLYCGGDGKEWKFFDIGFKKATQTETNQGVADRFPDASMISQAPYIGRRNLCINGSFEVWQRGAGGAASFASPASGTYTADRWRISYDGTIGTFTIEEQTHAANTTSAFAGVLGWGPRKSFRWNHTSAGSGQSFKSVNQRIENLKQFAGRTITVSFGANTPSNHSITVSVIYNFGTGGSPSATRSAGTSGPFLLTAAAQRFSYTLTIDSFSSDTFGTDDNSYLQVQINMPLNQTHDTRIFGVQVEIGAVATPFEPVSFGDELRRCQRYYWKSFPYSVAPAQNAGLAGLLAWPSPVGASTASSSPRFPHPVPMRAVPTLTSYNPLAASAEVRNITDGTNCTATGFGSASGDMGFGINYTTPAGTAVGEQLGVHVSADAEL